MGVKFNREYSDISADLVKAIYDIADCYEFLEMTAEDWETMEEEAKLDIIQTLSDDLFYGLGDEPTIQVGSGQMEYDPKTHVIKVTTGNQVVHLVQLI